MQSVQLKLHHIFSLGVTRCISPYHVTISVEYRKNQIQLEGTEEFFYVSVVLSCLSHIAFKRLNVSKTKYNLSGSPIRSAKINPA